MASPDEIRAGGAVVEFSADTRKLKHDLESDNGGVLETLKHAFGRGSNLKEYAELIEGGGVVAGLTLAGRSLGELSSKAVELHNAFESGSISAGAMAEEIAKSIPVLGNFWQIGRNIRELLTGGNEEEAKLLDKDKDRLAVAQTHLKVMEDVMKRADAARKAREGIPDEMAVIKATDEDAPFARAAAEYNKKIRDIDDFYDKAAAKYQPGSSNYLAVRREQEKEAKDAGELYQAAIEKAKYDAAEKTLKQNHQNSSEAMNKEVAKDDSLRSALNSFFEPIEDSVFENREKLRHTADSIKAATNPFDDFREKMEKTAVALHEGYLSQDEYDRAFRSYQEHLQDATTKFSSRGIFNSAATQSLQGNYEIPKLVNDSARVRQIMEQIWQKIQNHELSLNFT